MLSWKCKSDIITLGSAPVDHLIRALPIQILHCGSEFLNFQLKKAQIFLLLLLPPATNKLSSEYQLFTSEIAFNGIFWNRQIVPLAYLFDFVDENLFGFSKSLSPPIVALSVTQHFSLFRHEIHRSNLRSLMASGKTLK